MHRLVTFVGSAKFLVSIVLFRTRSISCLASQTKRVHQVTSIKQNGGHSEVFSFDSIASGVVKTEKPKEFSLSRMKSVIRSTFLPSGYPARTPPGYMRYSVWSWIQDISTQLRGVLATQRVLEGVGVGREGATALSALMNFLVRDASGMAATLLFTSVASEKFKVDVKRWRLFADIMVDVGITLEVAALMVPPLFFLPMICLGNVCKAICGVAAGACGGSINLHWARGSDISDINAKFGAQHTVTGAFGLVFAAVFARSVSNVNPLRLWSLYTALTVLHLYANIRCMRLIAFDSFNTARMDLVLDEFLGSHDNHTPLLASPVEVAAKEPLFFGRFPLPWNYRALSHSIPIYLGDSFNHLAARSFYSTAFLQQELWTRAHKADYVISTGIAHKLGSRNPCVTVCFFQDISPKHVAKAYLHAQLLSRRLEKLSSELRGIDAAEVTKIVAASEALTEKELNVCWSVFEKRCQQQGWDLSKTALRTLGYELSLRHSDCA